MLYRTKAKYLVTRLADEGEAVADIICNKLYNLLDSSNSQTLS